MAEVGRLSSSTNSNSSFIKGIFPILGKKIVLHVFANCYKKEFSGTVEAVFCLKFLFYIYECLNFTLGISLPI